MLLSPNRYSYFEEQNDYFNVTGKLPPSCLRYQQTDCSKMLSMASYILFSPQKISHKNRIFENGKGLVNLVTKTL